MWSFGREMKQKLIVSVSSFVLMSCLATQGNSAEVSFSSGLADAVDRNDMVSVSRLIEANEDVNQRGKYQGTALHRAAMHGYNNIAELLIKNGAKVDVQNVGGSAALHKAAEAGHVDLVELLLKNGASINLRDGEGRTPLLRATRKKRTDVVGKLLALGADAEVSSFVGESVIGLAVKNHDASTVAVLLKNGVDLMRRMENGQTVQEFALTLGGGVAAEVNAHLEQRDTELQAAILKENRESAEASEESEVTQDPYVESKVAEGKINQQLKLAEQSAKLAKEKIKAAKMLAEVNMAEAALKIEKIKEELEKARARRELAELARKKRMQAEKIKQEAELAAKQAADDMRQRVQHEKKLQDARALLAAEQKLKREKLEAAKQMLPEMSSDAMGERDDSVDEVIAPQDDHLMQELSALKKQLNKERKKRELAEKHVLDMSRIAASEILNVKKAWKNEVATLKASSEATNNALATAKKDQASAKAELAKAIESHHTMGQEVTHLGQQVQGGKAADFAADAKVSVEEFKQLNKKLHSIAARNLEMEKELTEAKKSVIQSKADVKKVASDLAMTRQQLDVVTRKYANTSSALIAMKVEAKNAKAELAKIQKELQSVASKDVAGDQGDVEPEMAMPVGEEEHVAYDSIAAEQGEVISGVEEQFDEELTSADTEETMLQDVEEVMVEVDRALSSGEVLGATSRKMTSQSNVPDLLKKEARQKERVARIERQIRALEDKKWQDEQLKRAEVIMSSVEEKEPEQHLGMRGVRRPLLNELEANVTEAEMQDTLEPESDALDIEWSDKEVENRQKQALDRLNAAEQERDVRHEKEKSVDDVMGEYLEKERLKKAQPSEHSRVEASEGRQSAKRILRNIKRENFVNKDLARLKKYRQALEDRIAERELQRDVEMPENKMLAADVNASEQKQKVAMKSTEDENLSPSARLKSVQEKMQAIATRMKSSSPVVEKMGNKRTVDMLNDEMIDVASGESEINVSSQMKMANAKNEMGDDGGTLSHSRRNFLSNLEKKLAAYEDDGAKASERGVGGNEIAKLPWIKSSQRDAENNDAGQAGLRVTKVMPVDYNIKIKTQVDANRENLEKTARIIASIQKASAMRDGKASPDAMHGQMVEQRTPDSTVVKMTPEIAAKEIPASMRTKRDERVASVMKKTEAGAAGAKKEFELHVPQGVFNANNNLRGYWLKVGEFVDSRTAYQHYKNVRDENLLRGLKYRPVYTSERGFNSVAFKVGPLKSMKEATNLCMKFRGDQLGCSTIATK